VVSWWSIGTNLSQQEIGKQKSCGSRILGSHWTSSSEVISGRKALTADACGKIPGELKKAIIKKQGQICEDGIFLLHGNLPAHTSNGPISAAIDLGFIPLGHPAYSTDLAPSDYHSFSEMKKFLRDKLQIRRIIGKIHKAASFTSTSSILPGNHECPQTPLGNVCYP